MKLLLILGLIHARYRRIAIWMFVNILIVISNMLFATVLDLTLVREGYETTVHLMNTWELILGIFATFLVTRYREKLMGYVPLTIFGEVIGIATIVVYTFSGLIVFVFVGNSLITLTAQVRIVFLTPALREVAKNERFDDQVTTDSMYLIIYLIAMGMSLLYTLTPLYLAAACAGVLKILAATILSKLKYPEKLTSHAKDEDDTNGFASSKLLIFGGIGVLFTLQCVIAIRPMASENEYVTVGFYTVFYISSIVAVFVALWIKHDGRRTLPVLIITRTATPLLFIAMSLALLSGGLSWSMVFVLYFVVLLHGGPFNKLVHANAVDRVLAQTLSQRSWLVTGLAANILFFMVFTWLRDSLPWIMLGLTLPASISLIVLLLNKDQHIIREAKGKDRKN